MKSLGIGNLIKLVFTFLPFRQPSYMSAQKKAAQSSDFSGLAVCPLFSINREFFAQISNLTPHLLNDRIGGAGFQRGKNVTNPVG